MSQARTMVGIVFTVDGITMTKLYLPLRQELDAWLACSFYSGATMANHTKIKHEQGYLEMISMLIC